MDSQITPNQLSTEELDAVLYGHISDPSIPSPADAAAKVENDILNNPTSALPTQTGTPAVPVVQESTPEVQTAPAVSGAPVTEPPAQTPGLNTEGWSEVDRLAMEFRQRNPDLSLEESLERAKARISETDSNDDTPTDDTTPDLVAQLAEVERQLDEAGANEGLVTPEIINLQKQFATLSAKQAVIEAEGERAMQVGMAELNRQRQESHARVLAMCAEAGDPNTDIGRAISQTIDEMRNNPLLQEPDAPEIVLHLANRKLPPEKRINLATAPGAAPISASEATSQGVAAGASTPPSGVIAPEGQLRVATASPVSGSAASAPPVTKLNPGDLRQTIRETPTADLEAAIYGDTQPGFFMR